MQGDVDRNPGSSGSIRGPPMAFADNLVSAESPARSTRSLSVRASDNHEMGSLQQSQNREHKYGNAEDETEGEQPGVLQPEGEIGEIVGDGLKGHRQQTRLHRVCSNLSPWQTDSVKSQQSADASANRRQKSSGEGTNVNASPTRVGRRLLCMQGKGERQDLRPNKVHSVPH